YLNILLCSSISWLGMKETDRPAGERTGFRRCRTDFCAQKERPAKTVPEEGIGQPTQQERHKKQAAFSCPSASSASRTGMQPVFIRPGSCRKSS
ncbi:hypothetical protein, partial [Faecalibaculum rodentium]|uniref:hypothetical protein n=1 Tax=Faecalibaculum rodentium TaxID=1702221 RepID=UPI0026F3FDDA